jgi:hypothetical protein
MTVLWKTLGYHNSRIKAGRMSSALKQIRENQCSDILLQFHLRSITSLFSFKLMYLCH